MRVQRLLEIDDVDAVALTEDEPLHLRVPAPGLVPEVDTGLEHLLHGDDGHDGVLLLCGWRCRHSRRRSDRRRSETLISGPSGLTAGSDMLSARARCGHLVEAVPRSCHGDAAQRHGRRRCRRGAEPSTGTSLGRYRHARERRRVDVAVAFAEAEVEPVRGRADDRRRLAPSPPTATRAAARRP